MTNLCVNCEWYYTYDDNVVCNAFKNPLTDGLEKCPEYQMLNKGENEIRQKELEKKYLFLKLLHLKK